MGCKYIVVRSTYINEKKTRTAYGIAMVDDREGDTIVLESYEDLSQNGAQVAELVHSCNSCELDPIHLKDILEDFLG